MRYGLRAGLRRFKYFRYSEAESDSWFRIQDFTCNLSESTKTVRSNSAIIFFELNRLVPEYISNLNSFSENTPQDEFLQVVFDTKYFFRTNRESCE